MKKIKYFLFSVLAISMICYIFSACTCIRRNYNEVFFTNWGIELPEIKKELFRKSDDHWHGDGVRYAVFLLDKTPEELIFDFFKEKNSEFESFVNDRLSEADFSVPEKYLPQWDKSYCWKKIDIYKDYEPGLEITEKHCCMIYFPEDLILSICQYYY